jgi:hypothetical protein
MPRYSVKVHGAQLSAAMLALNASGLPTLGAGAYFGNSPPPDWDLTSLRAVFEAGDEDAARKRVLDTLPRDVQYEIGEVELVEPPAPG